MSNKNDPDAVVYVPKLGNDQNIKDEKKTESQKNKNMTTFLKKNKKTVSVIALFLMIFLLIAGYFLISAYSVYKNALVLKDQSNMLIASAERQNLNDMKTELQVTEEKLANFENSYKRIKILKILPYFGKLIDDGDHVINAGKEGLSTAKLTINVIEPYADIFGFDGANGSPQSGEETAQDRLDFVIRSLPEIIPETDEIVEKVKVIKTEIDQIDPNDYPKQAFGYEIQSNVKKLRNLSDTAAELVINGKPLLEKAPYILGSEEERTYLVLFQNDKELRPTGGFITAYSIAKVERGKFEPVSSSDIYNLDNQYTPTIQAPLPIINYLKGPYLISNKLRLRDMNWDPDFSHSMDLFTKEIKKAGIDGIDGIIAVDTQLLVNILDALGPIGVPGYGNFSTEIVPECKCPQVIYELESFADIEGPIVWSENEPGKIVFAPANYDNRKKIIGPLMNSVLSNSLGQSKEKIPGIFEAIMKSLTEKHLLIYMLDDEVQEAVELFGIGGTMKEYEEGDYLSIVDANLGGRKSNLYVTYEVEQEVEISGNGEIEKTLILTYKNPEPHDGWLNSVLPNFVRIYVPDGSTLISTDGFQEKSDPYEEFGKTVFSGFFELRPQGVSKITIKYKIPYLAKKGYKIFIQKQPGKDLPFYSMSVGKNTEEFFLDKDREFTFEF